MIAEFKDRPNDVKESGTLAKPTVPSIADQLRELKKLREENLISQEVYELKQKEIVLSR